MSPKESDEELFRGFAAGDPAATHHVRGWVEGVVHLGRWNFEDAEGVCQEVLIKLLEIVRSGEWQRRSSFKTFVFSIARYTCIDVYRRERSRGLSTSMEEAAEPAMPALQQNGVERREQLQLLQFVLQQLPEECCRLWNWVYRDCLSAPEIAPRLGITAVNVRVRVHRCLQKARAVARTYEGGLSLE